MSGFFRTYLTFNFLARFHFSVSYSASVEGTVANSMLFAPVPCNASINKSSASTGLNNVLRMSVTSLLYLSSPCAKHSGKVKFLQDHFIFDHPNSYLRMPTKEKFYEYVRNATHGKKCYVIQGSRKMFLTVPAKVFHCFDADRQ